MTRRRHTSLTEAEFDAVMTAHFDDIWRYTVRRLGSPDDADDATAEVFANLWRRRHDCPPDHELRLWLFGVARNVVANQTRSANRRRRLDARLISQPVNIGDGTAPVDTGVWQALAELSEADRDLLLMRAWDDLPVADIAHLLGCTRTAASLRLRKARQRLAAELRRFDQ